VFEQLRQRLQDALNRAASPAEGRAALALMREAIIEAKVAVRELRSGVEETKRRLVAEREALETVRRRGRLAADINDAETVRVAAEYERRHGERVAVLERKLTAQEAEVALAERELADMTGQLKLAAAGAGLGAGAAEVPDDGAGNAGADADLRRNIDRTAREAHADQLLAELKRRMGK
jgi:hypothetical protein